LVQLELKRERREREKLGVLTNDNKDSIYLPGEAKPTSEKIK